MIDGLKPYPEYKAAMVSWLGKIPGHWAIEPGFAAYREKHQKNLGMVEKRVLSLSYGRIVIKPEEKLHGLVPKSFGTYQIVEPGDIIIRSTDLQNDWTSLRVGLVRDRGIITSAYLCLKMVGPISSEYGYLQLHALDLLKVFYGMGSGLRQNLNFSDFKRMPILLPPRHEQGAIVRFLDHANRRIERYIRAKKKLIALLNEQKQAIIHRAVTRGLNPNVRLKPSGIPWLGEIPEHWEVRRLRTLVRKIEQGVSPQAEGFLADDSSWGVLKAGCVNRGLFRETEHKRLAKRFPIDPSIVVKVGDVLVSRASGSPQLVGSVGKVQSVKYRLILSDKTFRPVFRGLVDVDFIVYAMNSRYYRHQVEQAISGAEGLANNLPLSSLRDFLLAVPPLEEATNIAEHLRDELKGIDSAIVRADREVELIREYRTRLVADVVTGQLDVRAAAAKLPDEPEELELLDETEASVESEEALNGADLGEDTLEEHV